MTSDKPKLKVVFNATSLRPGGGLTVLLGVLRGLARQTEIGVDAFVVCSATGTADEIRKHEVAKEVIVECENQSVWKRQWFVRFALGKLSKKLGADLFFSVNQYVANVECPQIVYHINLLRFLPVDKTRGMLHQFAESLRNKSAKQAIQQADANVFESAYIQSCATELYGRPINLDQVIYIGLPDDLIENRKQQQERPPADCATFVAITNHNEHKDNPTLMRCLHSLATRHPDISWKLKIAGSIFPERWRPFQELADSLGVSSRIDWLGFVSQAELTDHLESALCLVSTSRVESFCMVALESMARACPTIVADASAMPESVGDAAVLVTPGDYEGFADAIAAFYKKPDLRSRYVERGMARIENFRWDRCGNEFARVMQQLATPSSMVEHSQE